MSTACKCDRCGSLFEWANGLVNVSYSVTTSVDPEGDPTMDGYDSDLCGDCSKKFLDFIRNQE